MKTKHTPGPWVARKWKRPNFADGFVTVVTDNRGHGLVEFLQKGKNAKVEANAHLIAAAPDLLAALERLFIWRQKETPCDLLEQVEKVIAKATGA